MTVRRYATLRLSGAARLTAWCVAVAAALLLLIPCARRCAEEDGAVSESDTVVSAADAAEEEAPAAEEVSAAAITPAEELYFESCTGGETVSESDTEMELTVPANVRLDRIVIDMEVTHPLDSARVTSLFGYRKNPVSGKYSFHTGMDLAAPGGANIYAMYGGRVKTAAWDNGYGNYIVLDHGGFQTLYAHCSKLKRSAGDKVKAGEVIALVGTTGNSTGNHLHVEFRRDGQRYDPEWILGGIYT